MTRCAARIRDALGDGLAGIYLGPWERTLYVVLHRTAVVRDGEVALDQVEAIESALAEAVGRGLDGRGAPFALKVRVGSKPPRVAVVPVDAASAPAGGDRPNAMDKLRTGSIAATVAAFFGLGVAGPAIAASEPAVSAPNAKISVGGGAEDGDGTFIVEGSGTVPVGHSFGAMIDAYIGGTDGDVRGGVGGHLFWRDPDTGLIGAVASYSARDNNNPDSVGRVGVEGEVYLGQFTGFARAGLQFGDADNGGFGRIDVRWYATDDFMLSVGGETETGSNLARFGGEFQPGFSAMPGLSLFADGEVGDDDWDRFFVGVRFYFDETKSLIRRHRTDDPPGADDEFAGREGDNAFEEEFFCWVAREVYGADGPEWRMFRFWMLNQAPDWFRHLYIRRGQRFATWIGDKSLLKKLIRAWMDTRLTGAV